MNTDLALTVEENNWWNRGDQTLYLLEMVNVVSCAIPNSRANQKNLGRAVELNDEWLTDGGPSPPSAGDLQVLAQKDVEEKGTEYNRAMNNLIRFYFPTSNTRKFIRRHLASLRRQEAARPSSSNGEDVAVTTWNTPPASPDGELEAELEAVTNPFWGAETLYQWVMEE
ncbi:hypothetical protein [Absidia glauca]|uniref:Uncharacterized protein n=1 Tax=Absidia glauca TaxID=4829 RepID=A0A163JCE6_ABSGL|nr:hypothetical protein [Absidia glauca]